MLGEMTNIDNKNRNKHIAIFALGRITDTLDIPISKLFKDYWL